MSDVVLVALISAAGSAVISVGVVAVNLFYHYRSAAADRSARTTEREEDRREWYERTMFKKRLLAAQEANAWVMKLNHAIDLNRQARVVGEDSGDMTRARSEIAELARSARDWYDDNAYLLTDGLPSDLSFVGLTNAVLRYVRGEADLSEVRDFWRRTHGQLSARVQSLLGLHEEP